MGTVSDCTILGVCPVCESPIPTTQLAIAYTPDDGWPRMLSECAVCERLVGPV